MLFFLCGTVLGQDRAAQFQDRIEAQRVAFITQKLDLTSKESADFWPLYNTFKEEQKELRKAIAGPRGLKTMSDAEADAALEQMIQSEQDLIDLKRNYIDKFKTVIPATKVAMLFHVEQAFNREILNKLRERRGGPRR